MAEKPARQPYHAGSTGRMQNRNGPGGGDVPFAGQYKNLRTTWIGYCRFPAEETAGQGSGLGNLLGRGFYDWQQGSQARVRWCWWMT